MSAAAYALDGLSDVAKAADCLVHQPLKTIVTDGHVWFTRTRGKDVLSLALNAMKDVENGMVAVKKISDRLNAKRWMSTQETSFSLLAISDYMAGQPVSSTVNLDMNLNDQNVSISSQYSVYKQEFHEAELTNKTIKVTNTSNGLLYLNTSSYGKPLVGKRESFNEIIDMEVNYRDKEGNAINVNQLAQNKDFLVSVIDPKWWTSR